MLKQESILNQQEINMMESIDPFQSKTEFEKNMSQHSRSKYPDFRFSCPNCGTLDVLILFHSSESHRGSCLECKTQWNEVGKQ